MSNKPTVRLSTGPAPQEQHKLPEKPKSTPKGNSLVESIQNPNPIKGEHPPSGTKVLYHQLQVTMPSAGQFVFTYLSGSGIKNLSGAYTIDDFMADLESDPGDIVFDRNLYNIPSDAPNIVVREACYVVVQLFGDPNVRFKPDSEAIDTAIDFSTNYKYCNLIHYDTSWTPYLDQSGDDPCYVIQFDVSYVEPPDNDQFNINLQVGTVNGQPIFLQVDPALKNRGPHGIMMPAAEKKRAMRQVSGASMARTANGHKTPVVHRGRADSVV